MLTKGISLCLVLTLLVPLICLSACDDEPGFGIYLVETGELVLSDQHIEGYYWDSHAIELNAEGIEKWNSYMTYGGEPKLQYTLYGEDFVLKVKGEEIYRGKFYSMVSSASYYGIVILEILFKLDESKNTIIIQYGFPRYPPDYGEDPRNNQKIFDYLDSKNLLRPGEKWLFE
jgi:hypothetical protein